MTTTEYAFSVFSEHLNRVRSQLPSGPGLVGLELGPGDSLASAVIGKALGFKAMFLVDVGRYASEDMADYVKLIQFLEDRGFNVTDLKACATTSELLAKTGSAYLTCGLRDLRSLPAASVDFIWSQAVLEHVKKSDFLPTMIELRRVLKPQGASSHRVDLSDHLGGSLNNLRFSERLWESNAWASSGFYTNRIRCADLMRLFEDAGFVADIVRVERWSELPTPRKKFDNAFRTKALSDLLISGFDVVLRPRLDPTQGFLSSATSVRSSERDDGASARVTRHRDLGQGEVLKT